MNDAKKLEFLREEVDRLRSMVSTQIREIIELQKKADMANYSKSDDDHIRALELETKVEKLIDENQDLKKENEKLKNKDDYQSFIIREFKEDYDRLDKKYKQLYCDKDDVDFQLRICKAIEADKNDTIRDLQQEVKDLEKANEDIRHQCLFYKSQYEDLSKKYHEKWNQVKIENERLVQRVKDLELDNLNLNSENESYHSCIKMLTENKENLEYNTYKEEEK